MQLYQPAHIRLSRFVQSSVWNVDDAKDIISETVLVAFEKFESMVDQDKFLYFLFGIATNLIRKKQRHKRFWGIFQQEKAEQFVDGQMADETLLRRELYEAMQKLTVKQRDALILFEITGFSIKEIAVMQELSESGVKSNLRRGREELAKLLSETQSEQKQDHEQLYVERSSYGQ